MPVIKPTIKLASNQDILQVVRYCADPSHPNHLGYTIDGISFPVGTNANTFAAQLEKGLITYNLTARRSHQVKHHGEWWITSFAPGSFLTDKERRAYEYIHRAVICSDGFVMVAWHNYHQTDQANPDPKAGAADLNLITPSIARDPILKPRRQRGTNTYLRLRAESDKLTAALNDERAAKGELPIPMVQARRCSPLVIKISTAALKLGLKPAVENLPFLFRAINIANDNWWMSTDRLFFKKKKKRHKSIPLLSFLGHVAREMRFKSAQGLAPRLPLVSATVATPKTDNQKRCPVLPPLASSSGVIQHPEFHH